MNKAAAEARDSEDGLRGDQLPRLARGQLLLDRTTEHEPGGETPQPVTEGRVSWTSRLARLFTPLALAAFALGLWLGYLGAVEQFRTCLRTGGHHGAASCPEWISARD